MATTPQLLGISLPKDQYLHSTTPADPIGAPTEWWWHIGTLTSADHARTFGFEINATSMSSFGFTQIEITDVGNKRNYQKVTPVFPMPPNWAESEPDRPWYVRLGGSTSTSDDGAVSMQTIDGNALHMNVEATFVDVPASTPHAPTPCKLSLQLYQEGAPLLVWGSGCREINPSGHTDLTRCNFYYSLTRLRASGVLNIGSEQVQVEGLTWMDHEYGAFGEGTTGSKRGSGDLKWTLQDMQLSNGVHLSNFTTPGEMPKEDKPMESNATLLWPDGHSTFMKTTTTPRGPCYVSAKNVTYFLTYQVDIAFGRTECSLTVTSLFPDQLFRDGEGAADIYEGVASCDGVMPASEALGSPVNIVSGTAWIEQSLG